MTTQEQIKKTAQEFGVPMPETCKALDWQKETILYWVKHNETYELCVFDAYRGCFASIRTFQCVAYKIQNRSIPAPQMHELIASIDNKEILSEIKSYVYYQYDNIAECIANLILTT